MKRKRKRIIARARAAQDVEDALAYFKFRDLRDGCPRNIEPCSPEALQDTPVVLLTGPRRAGLGLA